VVPDFIRLALEGGTTFTAFLLPLQLYAFLREFRLFFKGILTLFSGKFTCSFFTTNLMKKSSGHPR
jgi:hypothetical protein